MKKGFLEISQKDFAKKINISTAKELLGLNNVKVKVRITKCKTLMRY